jgi:hypothetical protein
MPSIRDTLELVLAGILEREAGARYEIPHRARDQHLSGAGEGPDAGTDVHGDVPHVFPLELNLSCVAAGTDLKPERPDRLHDGLCASNRPRGAIEFDDWFAVGYSGPHQDWAEGGPGRLEAVSAIEPIGGVGRSVEPDQYGRLPCTIRGTGMDDELQGTPGRRHLCWARRRYRSGSGWPRCRLRRFWR